MSQQTTAGVGSPPPASHVARDEATEVGHTAAEAGREVAGTAGEQARQVAQEAGTQARDLVGEARTQLRQQARTGQRKATGTLRSLADELTEMGSHGQGPAAEVTRQAADRVRSCAELLDRREPGDLLEEFRGMARRRPGAFLLGAAALGVLAGRLTRGVVDASSSSGSGGMTGSGPAPRQSAVGYPDHPSPAVREPGPPMPSYPPGPDAGTLPAPPPPPPPGSEYGAPVGGPPPQHGSVPSPPPPGPAHAERPGAPSVGDYVDEIERERGVGVDDGPDPRGPR